MALVLVLSLPWRTLQERVGGYIFLLWSFSAGFTCCHVDTLWSCIAIRNRPGLESLVALRALDPLPQSADILRRLPLSSKGVMGALIDLRILKLTCLPDGGSDTPYALGQRLFVIFSLQSGIVGLLHMAGKL